MLGISTTSCVPDFSPSWPHNARQASSTALTRIGPVLAADDHHTALLLTSGSR